jgi:hypothetical protein
MPWSRKLIEPIILNDGRIIATLAQAREMMISIPPPQRQLAVWRFAAQRLNEASTDLSLLVEAEELLRRALKVDGLL